MIARVRNFQTAKDITLEIKGFTTVIGKSNSGKTGLFRAIEASLFNDPVSKGIRHGEKSVQVSIRADPLSFDWEKGDGKNDYVIHKDSQGSLSYTSVGHGVPKEIEDAGFKEFKIDTVTLRPQIAEWCNPVFMLDQNGKVITELISSITRLDVINSSVRKCSSIIRKNKSLLKVREDDLSVSKRRCDVFLPLESIDMDHIEGLWNEIQESEQTIGQLTVLHEKQVGLDRLLSDLALVGSVISPVMIPESDIDRLKVMSLHNRLIEISQVIERLGYVESVKFPGSISSADTDNIDLLESCLIMMARFLQTLERLSACHLVKIPSIMPSDDLTLLSDITLIHTSLNRLQGIVAGLFPAMELEPPHPMDITRLMQAVSLYKKYRDQNQDLESLNKIPPLNLSGVSNSDLEVYDRLRTCETSLTSLRMSVATLEKELLQVIEDHEVVHKSMVKLKEELGTCPICGD